MGEHCDEHRMVVAVFTHANGRCCRAVSRKAAVGALGSLGGNARDSDSSDSTLSDSTSWIRWYCDLRGNEFFCEIDEEFIQDDFNLTGLAALVPNYEYALDVILDVENDDGLTEEQQEMIEAAAESLYGLIHARFILTSRGLALMLEKFHKADFGRCPRVFCHGQNVLPVGQSDIPRVNTAKVFCPRCRDLYFPKYSRHANVDGAYFGTTFPHLLMQTYPELVVPRPTQAYVPRIYGFKIHESATNAPRPSAALSPPAATNEDAVAQPMPAKHSDLSDDDDDGGRKDRRNA